jgi:hypothetical protein
MRRRTPADGGGSLFTNPATLGAAGRGRQARRAGGWWRSALAAATEPGRGGGQLGCATVGC